jgi:signal transduction histidine kinase
MPGTAGGPAPRDPNAVRTRFWCYDPSFTSANPAAPPVAGELISSIGEGDDVALRRVEREGGAGYEALVRMAWDDGPCAFVLVWRTGPDLRGGPFEALLPGLIVAAGVLIAVLLASGPVVRRIRRLEAEVGRSAEAHYDAPVTVGGGDEVADLARAFDEAARQVRKHVADVEEREGTLREFVANTTHDVMTPLTVLAGHLDALRPALEHGDEDARQALRDALSEVDYTTSLVANLATAAKLESGGRALALHRVDVCALVERVVARHGPLARARGVELNGATPEAEMALEGDVTLLEQAVGNVVQNAVRYNQPGGHVAVLVREAGAGFEIRVVDDGPGVSAGELDQMTRRGFRGSAARTRSESGRGLGLDITREVCERLGLTLRFGHGDEGGLVVTIEGPRS